MNPDNTQQPAGMPAAGSQIPMMPAAQKSGTGGVVVLVIIVLVLLAGGYFLMQKMSGRSMVAPETLPAVQKTTETGTPETGAQAAAVDPNTVQGTGTSIADIEKDLNATDLDSLVADLNAI